MLVKGHRQCYLLPGVISHVKCVVVSLMFSIRITYNTSSSFLFPSSPSPPSSFLSPSYPSTPSSLLSLLSLLSLSPPSSFLSPSYPSTPSSFLSPSSPSPPSSFLSPSSPSPSSLPLFPPPSGLPPLPLPPLFQSSPDVFMLVPESRQTTNIFRDHKYARQSIICCTCESSLQPLTHAMQWSSIAHMECCTCK